MDIDIDTIPKIEKEKGVDNKYMPVTPKGVDIKDIPKTLKGEVADVIPKIEKVKWSLNPSKDHFKDLSLFNKIMDITGRPGYAFRNVLKDVMVENQKLFEGIPEDDYEAKMNALVSQKPKIMNTLRAVVRGFTREEMTTFDELTKIAGFDLPGILDLAGDVATDPLMHGGYNAITKYMGKGIKAGFTGVTNIPIVKNAIKEVGPFAYPVIEKLKTMFINKTGLIKLNEVIDRLLSKRGYLISKEIVFAKKLRNTIQNLSSKYKKSITDIEQQIINYIEQPQIEVRGLLPETKIIGNVLRDRFANYLTAELKAGVPITSLAEGVRGILYFPRIAKQDAIKYLKQAKIGNAKIWNSKLKNALHRKTGDFTLQEFNDFVASQGLEGLGGTSIEQFFLEKPVIATAIRGIRSAKAVTSAQFLDEIGNLYGKAEGLASSNMVSLPESIVKYSTKLKGLKFDAEVAKEIMRVSKSYMNKEELGMFLKVVDTVQNTWKIYTLAPFPKYHLRNMMGNLWNNYLAGVGLENYPKAQALQTYAKFKNVADSRLYKLAVFEMNRLGISVQQADDIIQEARELGVLSRGWFAADIEKSVEAAIGKKRLIGRLMDIGTTIENNARLAHYIDRLGKGNTAIQAAMSVKKFLFEYTSAGLTAFEREVMKRFCLFYTWTRKNLPLQLEFLWREPEKFVPVGKLLQSRDPRELLMLKYVRPDLWDRLPVALTRTVETATYIPLEGLIPAGDLSKMFHPDEILMELLTPYLKTPIEIKMNKSFYFEKDITKYDNQTQEFLRMDISPKLKYALVTMLPGGRLLSEIDKLTKKKQRGEKLTLQELAFSQSLSSVYKIDLKDLRRRAISSLNEKIKDCVEGVAIAKRQNRPDEVERIKNTLEQIKKQYKEIR